MQTTKNHTLRTLWLTGVLHAFTHLYQVGARVKALGALAHSAAAYYPLYGVLAGVLLCGLFGLPCLHAIQQREAMPPENAPESKLLLT